MTEDFKKLNWNISYQIEDIQNNKNILPDASGVYVFTTYQQELKVDNGVLYIGKAKSLRKRLSTYLSSPFKMLLFSPKKQGKKLSSSLRHSGKNLLLMEIQQKSRNGRSGIWLRWVENSKPEAIEKELIKYYQPSFNTSLNPRIKGINRKND